MWVLLLFLHPHHLEPKCHKDHRQNMPSLQEGNNQFQVELSEYLKLSSFCFYLASHSQKMGSFLLKYQVQLENDTPHQNLKRLMKLSEEHLPQKKG